MGDDLREEAIKAMQEQSDSHPGEIPTDPLNLTLGEEWEEEMFEADVYGPDEKDGIEASFVSGDESIKILPVKFSRIGESQEAVGYTADIGIEQWGEEIADLPTVESRTAFAVYLYYHPISSPETTFYTYTTDAGDALAIATWLTQFASSGSEMQRLVEAHGVDQTGQPIRTDHDRIDATLPDDPDTCLFEAKTTRSHEVAIPFRYAPLFDEFPTNRHNVPCIPETVKSLVGAVSHSAWEDHDLTDGTFSGSIERVEPGEYALDEETAAIVEGMSARDIGIKKFGE